MTWTRASRLTGGRESSIPDRPKISFVVIARNEASGIERALASILAQEGLDSREVIVVDDGSADATRSVVAELALAHPELQLISLERNRGRGYARDAGIRQARGGVLATVDADVILPPDWSLRCMRALHDADAVGGTAVPDGDVAFIYSRFGLEPRGVAHTTTVTGSNAAYRRELFDRVSFDVALSEGEDVALNYALRACGARLVSIPGLTVEHRESKTLLEAVVWLYQSGRGATRQLYRYREIRLPDAVFVGWMLSGAVGIAISRWRSRKAALALPLAYLAAGASAHVFRAFVWERRTAHRMVGAVLTDMALLSAYFAGRLTGLTAPVRSRVSR
jgi:succinoglycan biosynthesis protein ExoA